MRALSIITINLNNAPGLKKTIHSVESQLFKDYEFIIIDGGSTDESLDLIRSKNSVVDKWISEKDSGIYNAMNKGIGIATGEYLLFLNSGDYLYDGDVLQHLFRQTPEAEIFYGDMYIEDKEANLEYRMSPKKINSLHMLKDTLWHPVSFIHRMLFSTLGNYNESFKIVADYEFFMRAIVRSKVSTQYFPVPVSVFNLSGVSSGEEYRKLLLRERKEVQDIYLNPFLLFIFRIYSRLRN